jgi:hypothetical protein
MHFYPEHLEPDTWIISVNKIWLGWAGGLYCIISPSTGSQTMKLFLCCKKARPDTIKNIFKNSFATFLKKLSTYYHFSASNLYLPSTFSPDRWSKPVHLNTLNLCIFSNPTSLSLSLSLSLAFFDGFFFILLLLNFSPRSLIQRGEKRADFSGPSRL